MTTVDDVVCVQLGGNLAYLPADFFSLFLGELFESVFDSHPGNLLYHNPVFCKVHGVDDRHSDACSPGFEHQPHFVLDPSCLKRLVKGRMPVALDHALFENHFSSHPTG
jgi:hypothetical protein